MNTSHGIIWGIIFFFSEQVMRLFLKCILCQISPLSRGYNKKESLIAGTSWSPIKNYPVAPLSGFPALSSQGSKTCLSKAQVGVSHSVWKDVPLGLRWGQRIRFRQVLCVFPEFSQKLGSDKGQQIKNKKNTHQFSEEPAELYERERGPLKKAQEELWRNRKVMRNLGNGSLFHFVLGWSECERGMRLGKKSVLGSHFLFHLGGNDPTSERTRDPGSGRWNRDQNTCQYHWWRQCNKSGLGKQVLWAFHCHVWGFDLPLFPLQFPSFWNISQRDRRLSCWD